MSLPTTLPIARILFVEDVQADMELTERELRLGGFLYLSVRVDTEEEFRRALVDFRPDLILSDYSLPEFDGRRALAISLEHDPALPFIILTGSMNEETAVECMKAGATDYLIKGQTRRLVFALREALEQRRIRAARLRAEEALRESEAKARFLAENIADVLWMLDTDSRTLTWVSPAIERLSGYQADEIQRLGPGALCTPPDREAFLSGLDERTRRFRENPEDPEANSYVDELQIVRRDGTTMWVEVFTRYLPSDDGRLTVLGITRDISERKAAESRLLLQSTALEAAANAILIADRNHTILWANAAFLTHSGYPPSAVIGTDARRLISMVPEEGTTELLAEIVATIEAGKVWRGQIAARRPDGSVIYLDESITPVRDQRSEIANYVAIFHDVTERIRSQEALRLSEERYDLASRAANDALWDYDLVRGSLYIAPRFGELLGYPPGGGPRTTAELTESMHPDDRERLGPAMRLCLEGSETHFEFEHRLRCASGEYRWFRARGLAVRGADDRPIRFAGSVSDVTDRRVAEEQLLHDAFHDSLTGLPNRALFFDRLESAVRRSRRESDLWFAVMVLDLDRFKTVNDSLGHMAGDELLVSISFRIASAIRQTDTLARLGGDEFALLLEGPQDEGAALRIAERIVREIAAPIYIEGREISVSVSLGIAFATRQYTHGADIVRDADIALYRAKSNGRGRYEIFDPRMHLQAVAQLELEQDLRTSLPRGELLLHYQPVVALSDERIVGLEALIRWNHPRRGLVSPGDFVPLAEETGLIVPIGEWVLRESCRMLAQLRQLGTPGTANLYLSINLSARQVYEPGIVDLFRRTVADAGIDPARLHLEITESVLMDRPEYVAGVLADFAAAGFCIHLDDFGTGYSSLKYLLEFPIHSIKIDRSFVRLLPADRRAMALVQTVLLLADQLELGVTAEGVETETQLGTLRSMNCERVQGYLISRPVPEAAIIRLLERRDVIP